MLDKTVVFGKAGGLPRIYADERGSEKVKI